MIPDILFAASIIGICAAVLGRMLWKSEVEGARYKLFEVRDRLVLAVAKGQLDKDSALFGHYYNAVNTALSLTEKKCLEGLVQSLHENDLAISCEHADHLDELAEALKSASPEVTGIVADYYRSVLAMLLINSNFYRAAYHLSRKHVAGWLARWFERREPNIADCYRTIETQRDRIGSQSKRDLGHYANAA